MSIWNIFLLGSRTFFIFSLAFATALHRGLPSTLDISTDSQIHVANIYAACPCGHCLVMNLIVSYKTSVFALGFQDNH